MCERRIGGWQNIMIVADDTFLSKSKLKHGDALLLGGSESGYCHEMRRVPMVVSGPYMTVSFSLKAVANSASCPSEARCSCNKFCVSFK